MYPKTFCFHAVIPDNTVSNSVDVSAHTVSEFRQTLKLLNRIYHFLSAQEFLQKLQLNKFDRRDALLTLDDGFENQFRYALPVAEELKIPLTIFVNTIHLNNTQGLWFARVHSANRNGKATPDFWKHYTRKTIAALDSEIKSLDIPLQFDDATAKTIYGGVSEVLLREASSSAYLNIGAHSHTHPRLTNESDDICRNDILQNKSILENITGKEINLFAYPEGDCDDRVAEIVKSCGFKAAFSVTQQSSTATLKGYTIPRTGIYRSGLLYTLAKALK